MELRDVHYFAVLAKHGNVRRASEALDLSPGALSKSLHRLEQSVQARLFERKPKGVELTPVGAALLHKVGELRRTYDDLARQAADLGQGRAGHLRVGASPLDCEELPAACTALLAEAPRLTFELTVSDNDVLVPLLQEGKLDLVLNYIPPRPFEGLAQQHLYNDEYSVFAAKSHRLASVRTVPLSELASESWAMSTDKHRPIHVLQRVLHENGLPEPRFAVETRSVRLRLQIIGQSNLLGYGSVHGHRHAFKGLGLKAIRVPQLCIPKPVGVMYRKDAYLPRAVQRLIEILRQQLQKAG